MKITLKVLLVLAVALVGAFLLVRWQFNECTQVRGESRCVLGPR